MIRLAIPEGFVVCGERQWTMSHEVAAGFVCLECRAKELLEESQAEGVRTCARCESTMLVKRVLEARFVIDKCLQCGGVWLDAGELEKMRESAKDSSLDSWVGLLGGMFT